MAATIKIKNSSTAGAAPTASDLVQGELAVNVTDKRLYTENSGGTIVELGTNPSVPVTFPDGSASAPSLTNSGDTNTGMFFPAADTIAFAEGGTESMRLDSSGNLGLGVTPSAWTTGKAFEIGTIGNAVWQLDGSNIYYCQGTYYNSSLKYAQTGVAPSIYVQNAGAHKWYNAASGTAGNNVTFTQAMTLDASGNFMVGATSANGRARFVAAASADCILNLETSTNNYASGVVLTALNDNGAIYNYILSKTNGGTEHWKIGGVGASSALAFSTGGTERARIDSSGKLLVGTTSNAGYQNAGCWIYDTPNGAAYGNHPSSSTSGSNYWGFGYNGSGIGSITQNGTTAVAYNTTSDYRLKENVQPLSGALARVAALKPCTYTWKSAPDEIGEGFIAHELAEICPQAVTGEKDAVNEDGSIKPQSIDTSFLVATLTAAIQELKAIVDAQAAEIAALKG